MTANAITTNGSGRDRSPLSAGALGLIALAVGLIFGLPHLVVPRLWGPNRPYEILTVGDFAIMDDVTTYGARANRALDGDLFPGDVDLIENRGLPNPLPFLPTWIVALMSLAAGSVSRAFLAADFLLPPVLFLGFAFVFNRFLQHGRLSALLALTALFLGNIFFLFPPLQISAAGEYFQLLANSVGRHLFYSRFESPQLNALFLILALLAFERLDRGPFWQRALGFGMAAGLLIYVYIYYWLFVAVGAALWFGGLLAAGRREEAARMGVALAVIGLIAAPFAFEYWKYAQLPAIGDLAIRVQDQGQEGWAFHKRHLAWVALAFLAVKVRDRRFWLAMALFAAALICRNLHMVFSGALQVFHFHFWVLNLWGFAVVGYALKGALERTRGAVGAMPPQAGRAVWKVLLAAMLAYGLFYQARAAAGWTDRYDYAPEQEALFRWLNGEAAPPGAVVTPSFKENYLLPVRTKGYVFVPMGCRTFASDEEIVFRWLLAWKLFAAPEEDLQPALRRIVDPRADGKKTPLDTDALSYLFHYKYYAQAFYNEADGALEMPAADVDKIVDKYRQIDPNDCAPYLERHARYAVLSSASRALGRRIASDCVEPAPVYHSEGLQIYRFKNAAPAGP